MKIILSPAKTIKPSKESPMGRPVFCDKALEIKEKMQKLSPWELEALLKVNPNLGEKSHFQWQNMDLEVVGYPAALTYDGIVFKNLKADNFSEDERIWAQNHLVILSGFYGMIRAFDGILPYRLEMGTKLKLGNNNNLYDFWHIG